MSYLGSPPMVVHDTHARPLRNLRISVTDRCNLRCAYCMPEESYVWLPQPSLLSFEEIDALVDRFTALGVQKVRLTGGEPLLRRDLHELVALLARKSALTDLAITTNGVLLSEHASALKSAGLHRVTVSLDTLDAARFRALTRRDDHARVLAGIAAARAAGFTGTKLDMVVMRGVNDDEMEAMLEHARATGAELRYIEYMDVGGATRWSKAAVVPRVEILARLAQRYGKVARVDEDSTAPADRYALADGTVFGVISSTTQPFCGTCDRARLTADGMLYLCLYAATGLDLRAPLRAGATAAELEALIASTWRARGDRGAEERLKVHERAPLVGASELRGDPHLEMHTRGG